MRAATRDVHVFDLKTRMWNRKYPGLTPPVHRDVAAAIKWMYDAKIAEFSNRNQQCTYIGDLTLGRDYLAMLIGYSDTMAADPTLSNRPRRTRRVIQKDDGEGLDHSAHIYWYFRDQTNNARSTFVLEAANNLHSAAITRFLDRLLRIYASTHSDDFAVADPSGAHDRNGDPVLLKTRPKIELLGHPSSEFLRDLTNGKLTDVELYTEAGRSTPWDSNAYMIEEHSAVLLKPNPTKLLGKARALLDGISRKRKSSYEFSRIKFVTETGVPRTATVETDSYQLVNDLKYVRRERLDGFISLPNAFEKLYDPVVKKMAAIARA